MKKLFFTFILFVLFSFSLHPVFALDEDCTPLYSDSPNQCTGADETCVLYNVARPLYCVIAGDAMKTVELWASLGTKIFSACTNSKIGDTCNNVIIEGAKCAAADAVRPLYLCKPKNTLEMGGFTLPSDNKGRDITCLAYPSVGYSGDTNFYILINFLPSVQNYLAKYYVIAEGNKIIYQMFTNPISLNDMGAHNTITESLKLGAGVHNLSIWGYSSDLKVSQKCKVTIDVKPGSSSLPKCNVLVNPASSETNTIPKNTEITVLVSKLKPYSEYRVTLTPWWSEIKKAKTDSKGNFTFRFKPLTGANLNIFTKSGSPVCSSSDFYWMSKTCRSGGNCEKSSPPAAPPPCDQKSEDGTCLSIKTGLGISLGTDIASFTESLFSIVLGLSGGIALVLIIMSGFKILVSRGNPEKLQAAKQSLTSAIVGLVFIILALVILEIIGVNILQIPGFE